MGYTTLVAGTTITSSWANTEVRDQVISVHASATARDSAVTGTVEGMFHYLSDRDVYTSYNGSSWQDAVQVGAWDLTYTPTLTQSGTVAKTVNTARYTRIGKTIIGQISLSVTGSGTGTNPILFGLPVAARTNNLVIGSGFVYDNSANICYQGSAHCSTTSAAGFVVEAGSGSAYVGVAGMTAALATDDAIIAQFVYEAA